MALSECPGWRATKLGSQQGWPSGPVCIGRTATVYRVCSGLLGFFGGAANDRDGCPAVSIIAADGDQETHGGAIVAGDHSAVGGLEKAGLGVELAAVEGHDLSRGITGLEDVSGHRAFRRAELKAALFALGAGIEGDAQLRFTPLRARAHGDLSAGSVDADLTGAIHVDAAGEPPQAERHGHPTQNAQADEHPDDNQNNLERTSALRRGGSGRRGSCSRRRSARRASAHGGAAGSTEIVSFHQCRTTFRAKVRHGTLLVERMPVYRNSLAAKKSKVSECYSLGLFVSNPGAVTTPRSLAALGTTDRKMRRDSSTRRRVPSLGMTIVFKNDMVMRALSRSIPGRGG